ncbi:collagen-binding domain-containing protein, partial [Patulibacter sp. S7RM1-6]
MPSPLRRALRLPYLAVLALLVALGAVTAATWSGTTGSASAAAACTAAPLGAATGWTEFVRGDGRRGSSESEGKVAYGGDLDAGWMTIAMGNGSRAIPGTEPTLVVNGAGGSFNVNRGSAYVRDLRGGMNLNGGTGAKRLASSPLDVAAAFPDLVARSTAWGKVPATGDAGITLVDGFKRFLVLEGRDPERNVFTVRPEDLQNLEAVRIATPEGSTALINVDGDGAVTIDGEVDYGTTAQGGFTQASDGTAARNVRTLWNFPAATSVTLGRFRGAFGGTILAPNAAVTVGNDVGHNVGQVVARTFSSQRETHLHLFAGCLPAIGTDGGTPTVPTTTTTPAPTTTTPTTTAPAPTTTDVVPTTTTPAPTTTTEPTPTTTGPTTTPTTPTSPTEPAPTASLRVTKSVDRTAVLPGTPVSFTVTARNAGSAPAEDVAVSDLVPVGIEGARGDDCAVVGQVVRCQVGTLAPGASRAFVLHGTAGALPGVVGEREDQIVPFDAQSAWSLQPGEERTLTLACTGSAVMADASVRVADVDHGKDEQPDRSVVRVLREQIDGSTYRAVVANRGTGQAQGRLHGACLPLRTTTGREVLAGDPITKTVVLDARTEPYAVVFDCGTGRVPIGAGVDVPPGRARIVSSVPDGTSRRTIGLRVDQDDTEVTVGVRCVSTLTAPRDGTSTRLQWRVIERTFSLQPGQQVADLPLACGDQEKGIVAGWKLDYGLLPVGNEPQIKTRKFAIDNPLPQPTKDPGLPDDQQPTNVLGGRLYLLCLGDRLTDAGAVSDLVNTASATTSSPQDAAAVLSASSGARTSSASSPSRRTRSSGSSRRASPSTTSSSSS